MSGDLEPPPAPAEPDAKRLLDQLETAIELYLEHNYCNEANECFSDCSTWAKANLADVRAEVATFLDAPRAPAEYEQVGHVTPGERGLTAEYVTLLDRARFVERGEPRRTYAIYRRAPAVPPEHVCPDCKVERADYEGPNGAHLPTCPNCGSTAIPAPAVPPAPPAETFTYEDADGSQVTVDPTDHAEWCATRYADGESCDCDDGGRHATWTAPELETPEQSCESCQQWSDEADSLRWDRDMIVEERKAAEREAVELRAALAAYGSHMPLCSQPEEPCDCGFDAALGAVPPAPPEPQECEHDWVVGGGVPLGEAQCERCGALTPHDESVDEIADELAAAGRLEGQEERE